MPGATSGGLELTRISRESPSFKNTPPVAPLHPWVWPAKPWQHVHCDFAGPFQGSMFFMMVDAHSKWPEAFVMSSTTVSKTLDILRHVFPAYGLPEQLVSDNGPQFATFLKLNGVKHVRSASPCL